MTTSEHFHGQLVADFEQIVGPLPPGLAKLFDRDAPVPLALGIHEAIVAELGLDPVQRRKMRRVIATWCKTTRYLRALAKPGAMRHDIAGNPVAPVADDHRAGAAAMLSERDKRRAQQIKAERELLKAAKANQLEAEMLAAAADPLRAKVHALAAAKVPWKAIAAQLGVGVETIKAWLATSPHGGTRSTGKTASPEPQPAARNAPRCPAGARRSARDVGRPSQAPAAAGARPGAYRPAPRANQATEARARAGAARAARTESLKRNIDLDQ
jgi:sRNA-binding protein